MKSIGLCVVQVRLDFHEVLNLVPDGDILMIFPNPFFTTTITPLDNVNHGSVCDIWRECFLQSARIRFCRFRLLGCSLTFVWRVRYYRLDMGLWTCAL